MKYLGIDYGTKRVGIAISDASGLLARPFSVIPKKIALETVTDLCKDEAIETIVIGKSVDSEVNENVVQNEINEFVADITMRTMVPVMFQDEAFSSHVAHGNLGKEVLNAYKNKIQKTENLDARAAAVILQRYLDKVNKK